MLLIRHVTENKAKTEDNTTFVRKEILIQIVALSPTKCCDRIHDMTTGLVQHFPSIAITPRRKSTYLEWTPCTVYNPARLLVKPCGRASYFIFFLTCRSEWTLVFFGDFWLGTGTFLGGLTLGNMI